MSDAPVAVAGLKGVQTISAGGFNSLAVLADGTMMSWGDDEVGELGNGAIAPISATPVPVRGLVTATAAVASDVGYVQGSFGLALRAGGTVDDWGLPARSRTRPIQRPGSVA